MLVQRGIMKDSLDGCDGKSASGCLVYPVGYFPGYVHSGKRDVVPERESVSVSGLSMLKPRMQFCIPIEELDLESGVIDKKDLSCSHLKTGAEKNPPDYLGPTFEFCDHDLAFTSEELPLDRGAEKGYLLSIEIDSLPDQHILPEIMDVDKT